MRNVNTKRRRLVWTVLALGAVLAGCSVIPQPTADPTRYYLLSSPADAAPAAAPHGTLHIGIRAVEVPSYLRNTRSMVVRRSSNEIRYEDFARWAEPIEAGIQRTLRERLLADDRVATAEVPPFIGGPKRDYDVAVRIQECEGVQTGSGQGEARLVASYEILDVNKGGEVVLRRVFVAPESKWDGTDFGQLAGLLGAEATALGNDIAQNLPK